MSYTVDPYTGMQLYELSHVWNTEAPSYPGQADISSKRGVKHAQHGVLAWRISTSQHTGTHMVAPLHMMQKTEDLAAIPTDRLFGNGVVLNIPKGSFETISAADLEKAQPVKEGDIVVINTGWHAKYSDALEYYGEAPGLTEDAAEWLINKKVKIVAVDTPFIDCPLATSMGPHRGGPQMKRLAKLYTETKGKNPMEEHGKWYVAHKALAKAGIPCIQQVGGDVNDLSGKRATFAALPWKFEHGDACQIRFVAMLDPSGKLRIDSGKED